MSSSAASNAETLLATDDKMPYLCMAIEAADEVGVDTETTGLDVRSGRDWLTGLCLSTNDIKAYVPFRHSTDNVSKRWVEPLFSALQDKPLIWHNQKFDYHSIKTLGPDPLQFSGPQYDTLIIAHLVDEELYSKELDFLAKKFLKDQKLDGSEIKKLGEIYGWANIPPKVISPYGGHDAELTRRLKSVLYSRLLDQGLQTVYWDTEQPFLRLLYKMEQRGVYTNLVHARRKAEKGRLRMASIERQLRFSPASPVALSNYLLDELKLPVLAVTPKGKPSFNKVAMEGYDELLQASNNPTARKVAEYRGWQKAVTSLYEPIQLKAGPDGRVRTNFKQHGTVTGRLSSTDPNLQQVPRGSNKPWNGDAKACFTSRSPEFALFGWDYSQIELRLAAAYGREQVLLTEFEREGADPFNVLAPLIFGGHCTPFDRHSDCPECAKQGHDSKTFTYANLYGAGLPKIAAQLGRTVSETEPLYRNYKSSIAGIIEVSQQVARLVEERGWVQYWDGRRRHMKDRSDSYKAWNSLIQGGGAQLVKKAMLRCDEFADDDCTIVLTVHDEITFDIRREAIPDYEPKIIKAMTDWPDFGVKLAVEGKEWK